MPKLIVVGGAPATGKSTAARYLERSTGIKRISMDDLKESFFDVGGYKDRAWSKQIGQLCWPVFKRIVELYLERGDDVIAEATFLWPDDRDWIEAMAERYHAEIYQIWMTADPLVARERFHYRGTHERHPGHCDTQEDVIAEFDQRLFNRTFIPHPIQGRTCVVDTTDIDQVRYADIVSFLTTSYVE